VRTAPALRGGGAGLVEYAPDTRIVTVVVVVQGIDGCARTCPCHTMVWLLMKKLLCVNHLLTVVRLPRAFQPGSAACWVVMRTRAVTPVVVGVIRFRKRFVAVLSHHCGRQIQHVRPEGKRCSPAIGKWYRSHAAADRAAHGPNRINCGLVAEDWRPAPVRDQDPCGPLYFVNRTFSGDER